MNCIAMNAMNAVVKSIRMPTRRYSRLFNSSAVNARAVPLAYRSLPSSTDIAERVPLIILHGLLGSSSNFNAVGKRLSKVLDREIVLADLRNHGASPWSDSMAFEDMAQDVVKLIMEHGGRTHLCGHSLGGKVAMATALLHPETLASCTVVDISPVAYSTSEAQWTQIQQIVRKAASSQPQALQDRRGGSAMLAPEVPEPLRPFVLQNLLPRASSEGGGYKWRCNMQILADRLDQMAWFWSHPPEGPCDSVPTRFIAGSESSYIGAHTRPAIDAFFRRARVDVIEGAGHWVHADRPDEFVRLVQHAVEQAES